MNRRELLRLGVTSVVSGAASFAIARHFLPSAPQPFALVAPTFDTYRSTYDIAFPIMRERGLVGTFFIEPFTIDTVAGAPTRPMLYEMQKDGWEIGAYSGPNMVRLFQQDPDLALKRLIALKDKLQELGVTPRALAPNQRSWSPELSELAKGLFESVRVADITTPQPLPISDPRYVRRGGTASLSAADTDPKLRRDALQAITSRALWVPVIHQVGNDSEPLYSIPTSTFERLCDDLELLERAGAADVVTFSEAVAYIPRIRESL